MTADLDSAGISCARPSDDLAKREPPRPGRGGRRLSSAAACACPPRTVRQGLFAKPPNPVEVINDIGGEVTHFFTVLRTDPRPAGPGLSAVQLPAARFRSAPAPCLKKNGTLARVRTLVISPFTHTDLPEPACRGRQLPGIRKSGPHFQERKETAFR
jgi:hypothetical protein